jgi:hypothetical protein
MMFYRPADLMGKKGPIGCLARRAAFLPTARDHVRRLGLTNCTLGKRNAAALPHSAHWSLRSDEILATHNFLFTFVGFCEQIAQPIKPSFPQ